MQSAYVCLTLSQYVIKSTFRSRNSRSGKWKRFMPFSLTIHSLTYMFQFWPKFIICFNHSGTNCREMSCYPKICRGISAKSKRVRILINWLTTLFPKSPTITKLLCMIITTSELCQALALHHNTLLHVLHVPFSFRSSPTKRCFCW